MIKRDGHKYILVAPISGGSFPKQLSILRNLVNINYSPDIGLGSSGGAISLYLLEATTGKKYNIDRVIKCISSDILIEKIPQGKYSIMPSILYSFLMGCTYRISSKVEELFNKMFSYDRITRTELWVCAIDEITGDAGLFCNKSEEESMISSDDKYKQFPFSREFHYMDGNIQNIVKSVSASSSIPMVFESVKIGNGSYGDSGLKFASPLTPLSDKLGEFENLHIMYINGYDLTIPPPQPEGQNFLSKVINTGNHIVRSLVSQDINTAINLISRGNEYHYIETEDFSQLLNIYQTESSLVEIYVDNEAILNYLDFNGEDVLKLMDFCEKKQKIRIWWTGDEDIFLSDNDLDYDLEKEEDYTYWNYDKALLTNPNYRI